MQPNTESSSDSSKQAEPKNTKSNSKIKSVLLALAVIAVSATIGLIIGGTAGGIAFVALLAIYQSAKAAVSVKASQQDNKLQIDKTPTETNTVVPSKDDGLRSFRGNTTQRSEQNLADVKDNKGKTPPTTGEASEQDTTGTENPN